MKAPFYVRTSKGIFVGAVPSQWPLPDEVQKALDEGRVTWGNLTVAPVPADDPGACWGAVQRIMDDEDIVH